MLVSFIPPVHKDIPHEEGHFMLLRKPSGRVVKEAFKLVESEGRRGVRDFGAEIVKAFMDDRQDEDQAISKIRKLKKESEYDTDNFDRECILRSGIVGWSYTDNEGKPIKVTPEAIAELDEQTAQWALECIVEMIRPSAEGDKSLADAGVPLAPGDSQSTH